jgi:hypothetical protein
MKFQAHCLRHFAQRVFVIGVCAAATAGAMAAANASAVLAPRVLADVSAKPAGCTQAPASLVAAGVVQHCRWVCYPGSGCEYQCRNFPM